MLAGPLAAKASLHFDTTIKGAAEAAPFQNDSKQNNYRNNY